MSVPVVMALGGNLGDVRSTGEAALRRLHETSGLEVEQVSSGTRPSLWGAKAGS